MDIKNSKLDSPMCSVFGGAIMEYSIMVGVQTIWRGHMERHEVKGRGRTSLTLL